MKKYIYLVAFLFLTFIIASCDNNNTTEPTVPDNTGKIFINSSPAGAQIFVDGTNTSKVTPDSTDKLSAGNHDVTLKLDGYRDTTITVNVVQGLTTSKFVQLT
ncbi:MAG: PEGA domain-containing protein, partial [Ignavibacteriaceae bacterium]